MSDSTKRKDQSPSYLKLGMFSFIPKIVIVVLEQDSCLGSGYKYQTPAIVKNIQSINTKYFFGFTPTLRSRSTVDLSEFFNKQGCIDPVDSGLFVSSFMAYTFVCKATSVPPTSYELQYKLAIDPYLVQVRLHRLSSTSTARIRLRSSYRLYLRVASFGQIH